MPTGGGAVPPADGKHVRQPGKTAPPHGSDPSDSQQPLVIKVRTKVRPTAAMGAATYRPLPDLPMRARLLTA